MERNAELEWAAVSWGGALRDDPDNGCEGDYYKAGIEPVSNSDEKQMLTEMKLVQNTHWSLQCWYRTSLVYRRKTNPNRNQTGTKINTDISLQYWYRTSLVLRRKTNANRNQTGAKYSHWSLQCWYTTSLVFTRKTNANTNQTGIKYTLLLTMLVYRTSLVFRRKTNAYRNQTGGKDCHRSLQC